MSKCFLLIYILIIRCKWYSDIYCTYNSWREKLHTASSLLCYWIKSWMIQKSTNLCMFKLCSHLHSIFLSVYVSGFLKWYIVMRGWISDMGTRVYSYKCHIFVDQIATVVTTSFYIKYISGLKIIQKNFPQKYNKESRY